FGIGRDYWSGAKARDAKTQAVAGPAVYEKAGVRFPVGIIANRQPHGEFGDQVGHAERIVRVFLHGCERLFNDRHFAIGQEHSYNCLHLLCLLYSPASSVPAWLTPLLCKCLPIAARRLANKASCTPISLKRSSAPKPRHLADGAGRARA